MHGLQSDSSLFLPFFRNPSFSAFSILALDFIGFGHSDKPENFSYDLSEQAEILAEVLKQRKVSRITLIGHSLGGMVATLLLEGAESKVEQIISLEGNLCEADCGESLRVSQQSFEEFEHSYRRHRVPGYAFYRTSCSIVAWSRSGRLLKILNASPKRKLLILGENGTFASRPESTQIEKIPKAGHFLLVDQPEFTMAAISRFLEQATKTT